MPNPLPDTMIQIDAKNIVRRDDAFTAYINHTQMGFTRWDMQMIVSRAAVSQDKGHQYVEELGVLIMTPAHAKAVLEVLRANVEAYEAEHGAIEIPKQDDGNKPLASAAKPKASTK